MQNSRCEGTQSAMAYPQDVDLLEATVTALPLNLLPAAVR